MGDNKQDFFAVMLYFYMIFCINVMSEDYPEKVRLPFIEHGIHTTLLLLLSLICNNALFIDHVIDHVPHRIFIIYEYTLYNI